MLQTLLKSLLLFCAMLIPLTAVADILNYTDDPDLALALRYDSPPPEDPEGQNRDLAEKHYLAYLERCEEPFQRAKVYYALAVMYSINLNRKRGEKRDTEKATYYYQSVLQEEPERIGMETIAARAQLVTYADDVVRARMDLYEWFLSLKNIDLEERSLPSQPGLPPNERELALIRKMLDNLPKTQALNMINGAIARPNARQILEEIVSRFPDTLAGNLAQKALDENAWTKSAFHNTLQAEFDKMMSDPAPLTQIPVDPSPPEYEPTPHTPADPGPLLTARSPQTLLFRRLIIDRSSNSRRLSLPSRRLPLWFFSSEGITALCHSLRHFTLKEPRTMLQSFFKGLLLLFALLIPLTAAASILNYTDDPDLQKALECDLEQNGGDYDKADRALAEEYYLSYLERCDDSFQRAKVYYELGVMYSTAINRSKGETKNPEKAAAYFAKVLEEEPDRIGRYTIFARTQLASIKQTRTERLDALMDVYEWLTPIDTEKLRTAFLPDLPDQKECTPQDLRASLDLVETIRSMSARNIVYSASSLPNSREVLTDIVARFPGTEAAKLAATALGEKTLHEESLTKVAQAELDTFMDDLPAAVSPTQTPDSATPPNSMQPIPTPEPAPAPLLPAERRVDFRALTLWTAIAVAVLGASLYLVRIRRASKNKSHKSP